MSILTNSSYKFIKISPPLLKKYFKSLTWDSWEVKEVKHSKVLAL